MSFIPYLIIAPLGFAIFIAMCGRRLRFLSPVSLCLAVAALVFISLKAASTVLVSKVITCSLAGSGPLSGITLVVDGLSGFLLPVINIVAALAAFYSIGYAGKYNNDWRFYSLFLLMLAGINGVLIAGDIFNLYLFLELAAISGYFLVAFGLEPEALEASFKYAVMGSVASIFILLGIVLLYGGAGTLGMAELSQAVRLGLNANLVKFVSVLFLMGFGLKAAFVPFHAWLPYAHSAAPAPVSAMLSGVSIKVLGIYAIARVFFNIFSMTPEITSLIIALSILSMLVASFLAFGQSDIKRLFAYSSISQIGYIGLALAVGTPLAIFGGLLHIVNHSVSKSLLFMSSGIIEKLKGTRDVNKISGVISSAPATGYATLLGALSICGIPPLGGFASKFIIILACVLAGRPFSALAAVAASMLTLGYYFKALTPVLFGGSTRSPEIGDSSLAHHKGLAFMVIPVVILAVLAIGSLIFLVPGQCKSLLEEAVLALMNGLSYGNIAAGVLK